MIEGRMARRNAEEGPEVRGQGRGSVGLLLLKDSPGRIAVCGFEEIPR